MTISLIVAISTKLFSFSKLLSTLVIKEFQHSDTCGPPISGSENLLQSSYRLVNYKIFNLRQGPPYYRSVIGPFRGTDFRLWVRASKTGTQRRNWGQTRFSVQTGFLRENPKISLKNVFITESGIKVNYRYCNFARSHGFSFIYSVAYNLCNTL